MLNKKEIVYILAVTLILAFTISLVESIEIFLYTLSSIFLILLINISAKKIMSFYLDSEIEIKIWEIKRYGFKIKKQFKKQFPAGLFLPIIVTAFSFGYITWMASLVFDVKPKIYRAAKRRGIYSFLEMTESQFGLIASSGIIANLIIAVISYFMGFSDFARLNIYYAFFNMIPISDLDGNKIFFGNLVLWVFLAVITLIGLGYALFLI